MTSHADFNAFPLPARSHAALKVLGWTTPTAVQAEGLAPAIEGRDLLVCAPTGTGKTGLFTLALLTRLAEGKPRPGHPRGLVVTPTRELAIQIGEVLQTLGAHVVPVLFGGVSYAKQDKELALRPDIVVATPGRLLDHLRRGTLTMKEMRIVVFDEADRLFDSSFAEELRELCENLPEKRQTILLSATLPEEMTKLSRGIMRNPVQVRIGEIAMRERITEAFYEVDEVKKPELLLRLMKENPAHQTLIFARTRKKVEHLCKLLEGKKLTVAALHAGISQADRMAGLEAFRSGAAPILVATDLAARGLDIPELALVIHFDVPNTPEDYVHRSGRTGRLEREGTALTLVTPKDLSLAAAIELFLRRRISTLRLEGFAPIQDGAEPVEVENPAHWRDVERPRDLDERRLHKGKVDSPFTKEGDLRRAFKPPVDETLKPRRKERKRAAKRIKNAKLPHQRRGRSNPSRPGGGLDS